MPEIPINVPAGGASITAAFAGGRQIPIFTNVGLTTQAPLPIALSATSRTTLYIGAVGSYDIVVTDASGRVLEVAAGIAMSVEPLVFVPAGSVSIADGSATYVQYVAGKLVGPGDVQISTGGSAGIYVPDEFGSVWRSACQGAGSAGASLALLGDSVTFGYNASSYANSWAGKITADLKAKYGDGGSGFVSASRATTLSLDIATWPAAERIVPSGGAWASNGNNGPSNGGLATASPVTASSSLTAVVTGSVVRVFWRRGTGLGDFSWTIDGVSQGTVSTAGADSTQVSEVTGLSAGAHTVVLTVASGQNQVIIHGFSGSNATGITVDNFARPGSTANASSITGSSATFGKPVDWSGGGSYPRPAKCMLWAFGINDQSASVTEANFALFCHEWMWSQRGEASRSGNVDLVLVLQNNSMSSAGSIVYADYARRMRALAVHYGAAFVDMNVFVRRSKAFSTAAQYSGTNSPMGTVDGTGNNVHPSDAGSTLIYNAVKSVLVP